MDILRHSRDIYRIEWKWQQKNTSRQTRLILEDLVIKMSAWSPVSSITMSTRDLSFDPRYLYHAIYWSTVRTLTIVNNSTRLNKLFLPVTVPACWFVCSNGNRSSAQRILLVHQPRRKMSCTGRLPPTTRCAAVLTVALLVHILPSPCTSLGDPPPPPRQSPPPLPYTAYRYFEPCLKNNARRFHTLVGPCRLKYVVVIHTKMHSDGWCALGETIRKLKAVLAVRQMTIVRRLIRHKQFGWMLRDCASYQSMRFLIPCRCYGCVIDAGWLHCGSEPSAKQSVCMIVVCVQRVYLTKCLVWDLAFARLDHKMCYHQS